MTDNQAPNLSYPQDAMKALASVGSLVKEARELLPKLRREFRGEAMRQYPDGSIEFVQVSKPLFVKYDEKYKQPLKVNVSYKDGSSKDCYVPNEEAIEEILGILKSMGINDITFITNLKEDIILDDLLEFECKLANILGINQKTWGIDKVLLPMLMTRIKTLVQDARYMSREGTTIKAIQKTVQRVEQYTEGGEKKQRSPYQ